MTRLLGYFVLLSYWPAVILAGLSFNQPCPEGVACEDILWGRIWQFYGEAAFVFVGLTLLYWLVASRRAAESDRS